MTKDPDMADRLASAYPDGPNDADPWSVILAENHLKKALVGQTAATIIEDQFRRLRAGDRFWYERDLTRKEKRMLKGLTLSKIIELNTEINDIGDPWAAGN